MNKKILALIIVILLVIAGGAFAVFNLNKNNSTDENTVNGGVSENNQSNSQVTNRNENTAINNNEEQQTNSNTNTDTPKTGKALVLYFSQSGNTETVAKFIHDEVGGDIVKLETVKTYNTDYNKLLDEAQNEQRQNARPELKTKINIDDYDVIFLGYPNWWGDMPMPIYTFLEEYNFSGKTIAPFITHGGSGLSDTPNKIKSKASGATVTEGLAVSGSSASNSKSSVQNWLSKIGF